MHKSKPTWTCLASAVGICSLHFSAMCFCCSYMFLLQVGLICLSDMCMCGKTCKHVHSLWCLACVAVFALLDMMARLISLTDSKALSLSELSRAQRLQSQHDSVTQISGLRLDTQMRRLTQWIALSLNDRWTIVPFYITLPRSWRWKSHASHCLVGSSQDQIVVFWEVASTEARDLHNLVKPTITTCTTSNHALHPLLSHPSGPGSLRCKTHAPQGQCQQQEQQQQPQGSCTRSRLDKNQPQRQHTTTRTTTATTTATPAATAAANAIATSLRLRFLSVTFFCCGFLKRRIRSQSKNTELVSRLKIEACACNFAAAVVTCNKNMSLNIAEMQTCQNTSAPYRQTEQCQRAEKGCISKSAPKMAPCILHKHGHGWTVYT